MTSGSLTVTCASGVLADGVVDLEIYDPSGAKVSQQYWTAQSFQSGQSQSYSYSWTSPRTRGTYRIKAGVFGANWTPLYHWNDAAGSIRVN